MAKNSTNETRILTPTVWKNSLLTFFKIIFLLIFVAFYFIATTFFVYPQLNVKIFKFIGIKPAEEASLVQVYEKSNKDSDLYNLIIFEQENKAYEKQLYYINLLSSKSTYNEFCSKLDSSGAYSAGNQKTLIPYLCNTRSYLINQKIKCLWNLNLESSIVSFVYNSLEGDYNFEYSFDTYAELLNSKYSGDKLKEKFEELLSSYGLNNENDNVETLLNERIESLKIKKDEETEIEAILRLHTLSNLAKGKYLACYSVYGEESVETVEAQNTYSSAVFELNSIIN